MFYRSVSKKDQLSVHLREAYFTHHIVFVELPDIGASIEKDGTAGVVESTKAASDVYTPISGEVVENNQSIVDDPAKINSDPENEAWFFKLKIKDKSEMDSLMNKEEYDKFANESGS